MNLARLVVALAGLPETVGGTTVNRFCASSLQAIRMGFHAIRSGEGDTFVCAGVESYTRVGRGGMKDEDRNLGSIRELLTASLLAVKTDKGEIGSEVKLDSPPVWDGMAIAQGRLYVATVDGKVACYGRK